MPTAEQYLDELAEYQAQQVYLAQKKQELLDTVKVPAEVLAAQDEANKRRQEIDRALWAEQTSIRNAEKMLLEEVKDPEMPPEFVAALAAANAEREAIRSQAAERLEREQKNAGVAKAQIDASLQAKVADVYAQVEARKREIASEFYRKEAAVSDNIAEMEKLAKAAVIEVGQTVKGKFYQGVYVKGRVTWNTDMLDGMVIAFPALEKARKVGAPSVTLRAIK